MNDILRSHLSDLAEEVVSVDLRDRSITTSRRIGARRAVLATSTAAALVAVVAVAAYALRPASQDSMPPGTTPTGTATTEPTTAPAGIDGTAYYETHTGNRHPVYSWAGGRVTEEYVISAPAEDGCISNSVLVSPDGRYLAWVEQTDRTTLFGTLTVSRMDGTEQHQVANILCGADEADWTASPHRLRVLRQTPRATVVVDPATGQSEPAAEEAGWSANRSYRAYRAETGARNLVVEDASGRVVHEAEYTRDDGSFNACGYVVKAVSDDGRYVIIGYCSTDPGRFMFGAFLYDMVAKAHVAMPPAQSVKVIGFVEDGNVLLRLSTEGRPAELVLITPAGQVLDRATEPAELAQARLIGYKP